MLQKLKQPFYRFIMIQFLQKIYDGGDDYNFDIGTFPFRDGDVSWRPSYGVYIYINLFALPEHLRILLTSIIVTNF